MTFASLSDLIKYMREYIITFELGGVGYVIQDQSFVSWTVRRDDNFELVEEGTSRNLRGAIEEMELVLGQDAISVE